MFHKIENFGGNFLNLLNEQIFIPPQNDESSTYSLDKCLLSVCKEIEQ